ncbi:MAG TPA: ABC transporter ATP-binding protein [Actinobacteria bacterium]|nr:putative ABC transporter ATP-binding protein [bacterium BMS3Bbin01]HDH25779.1 ABC transporter ATP-binding protein [Actinomycetota bacterium]
MLRRYLALLVGYLRPQRGRVVVLTLLLLAGITFQLINPQIVRRFIDGATSGSPRSALVVLAVLFMALAMAQQAFSVCATYLAETVGWAATNELRGDLADHLLRLDMSFHKSHTPGELIERIDGDITALSNFFSQFVIHVAGNLVLLLGILVLLFRENPWIGLGISVFAVTALAGMIGIQALAMPWWKRVRQKSAEFYGFLGEQLGGTEDVRANGGVAFVVERFSQHLREWLPASVRGFMGWAHLWSTNIVLFSALTALVYWLGSRFFGEGALSIGSVYLVFSYSELMRQPMDRIRTQMQDLQKAAAALTRVETLLALESRLPQDGTMLLPTGALSVALQGVSFAYHDGDDGSGEIVLHDLDVALEAGRILGVLGRTGSGKTTLVRLLTRLHDPVEGTVTLGDVTLRQTDMADLRRRVGMVTQDVQLFRATVRDNLSFFDSEIDDRKIHAVLDELGLSDWVQALPHGLDTTLEAGGGGLSAGEAQLLAFTRIFLRDPGLVILDEASSRLDLATEQLIDRAVDRLMAGRTGIVIAHRLSTVTRADDILILEGGRVVEFGSREALVGDPDSRFSFFLRVGMEEVLE